MCSTRWLPVIAKESSFQFRDKALGARRTGSALGARYLVDGKVARASAQFDLTVTLTDAVNEKLIWSRGFRRPISELSLVNGEIGATVVSMLEKEVERAEQARAHEVEDRPELRQAVLDGRAGEGQPPLRRELLRGHRRRAHRVLDVLRLVEDRVRQLEPPEHLLVATEQRVARDDDLGVLQLVALLVAVGAVPDSVGTGVGLPGSRVAGVSPGFGVDVTDPVGVAVGFFGFGGSSSLGGAGS